MARGPASLLALRLHVDKELADAVDLAMKSLLCLVGLGVRAAFVVITVIPVVILLTIWWAMIVDYTVDRVSLFALIFSIGILVDDATVVVENIFSEYDCEIINRRIIGFSFQRR